MQLHEGMKGRACDNDEQLINAEVSFLRGSDWASDALLLPFTEQPPKCYNPRPQQFSPA